MISDTPNSSDPQPPPEQGDAVANSMTSTGGVDGTNALQLEPETSIAADKPRNQRPIEVTALLHRGEVHGTWAFANRQKARFFVLNLELVLSQLHMLAHTKAQPYFAEAQSLIANETTWKTQHYFENLISHTQIYPDRIREAKIFGHAATIIVAMEVAANKLRPQLNVYDYLRILPATFFVDHFDKNRLQALSAFHTTMTPEDRAEKFGAAFAEKSFIDTCYLQIEQNRPDVVTEIADGYCATKYTAERLMAFVNKNYPPELHIGPVASSGEDADNMQLGTKKAAPSLRVPRGLPANELLPCR